MNNWHVKIDGVTVKEYDTQEAAEQHAGQINRKMLVYGGEAYVEEEQ